MTAIVGLPLRSGGAAKPFIAAFVVHADGSLSVHTKRHLHAGEERHFGPGAGGPLLDARGLPLAVAICADFAQPSHAAAAAAAASGGWTADCVPVA